MKRALLLYGGWEGHRPRQAADFAEHRLLKGFEVVRSGSLNSLNAKELGSFDLLVPIWTFGRLSDSQLSALLGAVEKGLGMVAWHGAASSFLESRSHKLMLGGQFVGHFGGNRVRYPVRFLGNDPLVRGLRNFTLRSEQYYLLIDPAVKILAVTPVDGADHRWLSGIPMPVAWKRNWGRGRVFYCALGHTLDALRRPAVTALLRRAALWASRAKPPGSGKYRVRESP